MDNHKYAVPSLKAHPIDDKESVLDLLEKFSNIKEVFKEEVAINLYNECKNYNIDIPENNEIYRFISLKEEAINKSKVFKCNSFYVSNENVENLEFNNFSDYMKPSINIAIRNSKIFNRYINLNEVESGESHAFFADLYTCEKSKDLFKLIKIGTINVKFYSKYKFSYEITNVCNFDLDKVYLNENNNIDMLLDENQEDFFYLGESTELDRKTLKDSDFGIPEIKKFPMPDKKHVLLAIKFFNTYVGTKYEKTLADNINKKIQEFKILDDEIHMTNVNQFKKYYIPYGFNSSVKIANENTIVEGVILNPTTTNRNNRRYSGELLIESIKKFNESLNIGKECNAFYMAGKKLDKNPSIDEDLFYKDINSAIENSPTIQDMVNRPDRHGFKEGKPIELYCYIPKDENKTPFEILFAGIISVRIYKLEDWRNHYDWEWAEQEDLGKKNNEIVNLNESAKESKPQKCTKCGSKNIGIYIQGEPIYKCKDCGKYLGTVPFSSKNESKSILDSNYKSKGNKNLSSFKKIHLTESIISKYKKEYPFLKHVRCKDTKDYICDGYIWFDKNELVAMVGSCEYTDDKTKWVVSLEITDKYKGYNLSKQILDFAVKNMKCKYLSVNKNNEIAKKVYTDYGFKVYQESEKMYYMTIDKNNSLNESTKILDENIIFNKENIEYNLDKFENKDNQLLFVTGCSGGGKTTLSEKLSKKYKAKYISLDWIDNYQNVEYNNLKGLEAIEFLSEEVYRFLIEKNRYKKIEKLYEKMGQIDGWYEVIRLYTLEFLSWIKKFNKSYIIEGIQLLNNGILNNYNFKKESMILVNTSVLVSNIRKLMKDYNEDKEIFKGYSLERFRYIKDWFKLNAYLDRQNKILMKQLEEENIKKYINNKPINNITINMYHLSENRLKDYTELQPTIPDNFLVKNGYEDNKTKRVCFAPDVKHCLRGLSLDIKGKEFYVYVPVGNYKSNTRRPTVKEVPGAKVIKEIWITKPVKIICIGKIKVGKTIGDEIKYTYGKSSVTLHDWEWEWLEQYNTINESATAGVAVCPTVNNVVNNPYIGDNNYLYNDNGERDSLKKTISYSQSKKIQSINETLDDFYNRDRNLSTLFPDNRKPTIINSKNNSVISYSNKEEDARNIYKSLSEEELKYMGNLEISFTDVVYLETILVNNEPASFIKIKKIFNEGNGSIGHVTVCTKEKFRKLGLCEFLVKKAIKDIVNNGNYLLTLRWRVSRKNTASNNIAKKLGFVFSSYIDTMDKNLYLYSIPSKFDFNEDESSKKLEEGIISKGLLIDKNNVALKESPIFKSTKTISGLKRVKITKNVFERYSEELKRIKVINVDKIFIDNSTSGEILLNDNNNIECCFITEKFNIRKLDFNTLIGFYVNEKCDKINSLEDFINKCCNILHNKYMIQCILLSGGENYYHLGSYDIMDFMKNYQVLEKYGKNVMYTCCPELLEHYNLVINEEIERGLLNKEILDKVEVSLDKMGSNTGVYNKFGLWNSLVYYNGKKYRERCEAIIFDENNKVYMSINMNKFRIPGGGTEKGFLIEEQLINECREEARINIKDIEFIGTYITDFDELRMEIYNKKLEEEKIVYDGSINYLFVAKYDSKYTGKIDYLDKDTLIQEARFYPVSDVIRKDIKDEWLVAILYHMSKYSDYYKNLFNKIEPKSHFLELNVNNDNNSIKLESYNIINEEANTKLKAKRDRIENLIYGFFNIIDCTGKNANKYKEHYSKLSDKKFFEEINAILNNPKKNFYLEILPNVNEPNLKRIKESADFLEIELDEYIYYRHDGDSDEPTRSSYKVPVGELQLRRLQQVLSKKNTYSFDISNRNTKTNALTGHDKVARITDVETYQLSARGSEKALEEFMSSRSDNMSKKLNMYKNISNYGYVYLKDLEKEGQETKGRAINTVADFLKSAGLKNDL